jgi:hypothetical protein
VDEAYFVSLDLTENPTLIPFERRAERRRDVRLKTYLQLRGRSPAACEAINVSVSGALVRPHDRSVRLGEHVSLVIAFAHDNVVRTYYRKAIVVHVSSAGVGLKMYRHRNLSGDTRARSYSSGGNA